MLDCDIPNFISLEVDKLVFDYNGTLACDGIPIERVKAKLNKLAVDFKVYVLTADTFGTVKEEFSDVDVEVTIVDSVKGTEFKKKFIKELGSNSVIAVGNGSNDALMLEEARLGILIIGPEGAATRSLLKSDLVIKDINEVLDILLNPTRIIASLRR
ncbi:MULTISPECIES: HAD family hydrolase [unclassified Candidatus Frackibacter]|uniref:HAD family hydrolase n=1 Tax=unclassified Candidatus Frackibacter TaxID=2648818 RepID=UPI00079AF197|nr:MULTISPECIES: HAD family hydrolase [unclassified Candidatus Frackibacter]KXS41208.1 MAG: haloacid dehalogenase [Candidatus Frackibacter sp. T328-2]SDC50298.1 Soluble P-type ATPase [Candidatus Frackibacter sp. WG11]SEM40262.1 Soluble P-type ATPase [Candidatus Frackibacter sp. WG12]SFL74646.1 Soluble P-type ATPase [Candidatus Frackibacter sp. WG13]